MENNSDIEELLDIMSKDLADGWEYHSDDLVNLYIKNIRFKYPRPPHVRIRKDNGLVTCLNGLTFRNGPDNIIGWQMPCKTLLQIIRKDYENK